MPPSDTDQLHEQALALIESGALAQACALYERITALDPGDAEAWMMLGAVTNERGDMAQAIVQLRRAVDIDPRYTQAWIMLSGLFGRTGEMEQAEQCSRQALDLDPESVEARMNLANAQFQLGKTEAALESYHQVLTRQPGLPTAWVMLSRAHSRAEQWDDAENALQRALALEPRLAEAHIELGNVRKMQSRFDEARGHYEQALSLSPEHIEAHVALAALLYSQGRAAEALALYRQALRLDPRQPAVHYNVGVICQELGQSASEAEASYREAVRLRPDFVKAHHNLGRLLMAQGDKAGAIESFEQILRFKPDHTVAHYMLSTLGAAPVPSAAPSDYVAGLFDDYAGRFDRHLVEGLQYRIPEYLRTALGSELGQGAARFDVLDLGCGTGLCGALFRDLASRLTGVDLSARMIEKAHERGVYDELHRADITTFLQESGRSYDLILAADVFVYVGALDRLFAACSAALNPGGYFAFSVEAADDSATYLLRPTGRYAQSSRYIRALARSQALQEIGFEPLVVRTQNDEPIPGYVFILRRAVH